MTNLSLLLQAHGETSSLIGRKALVETVLSNSVRAWREINADNPINLADRFSFYRWAREIDGMADMPEYRFALKTFLAKVARISGREDLVLAEISHW